MNFKYIVYVDGGCYPTNPGRIGLWGIIVTHSHSNTVIKCLCGLHKELKVKNYTSIFMELTALSKCLEYIKKQEYSAVLIYSDSSYVVNIYNKLYKPHRYKREWSKIFRYKKALDVSVEWIRGHYNCHGNIAVDTLMRKVYLSIFQNELN